MLRQDSSQASLTRRASGRPPPLCSGRCRLLPGFQTVGVPSSFLTTYLYSTWLSALHVALPLVYSTKLHWELIGVKQALCSATLKRAALFHSQGHTPLFLQVWQRAQCAR